MADRLVALALERAEKKHGKARHLLSRETWEALVKAEAFDIISSQVNQSEEAVRFACAVQRSLSAGE